MITANYQSFNIYYFYSVAIHIVRYTTTVNVVNIVCNEYHNSSIQGCKCFFVVARRIINILHCLT